MVCKLFATACVAVRLHTKRLESVYCNTVRNGDAYRSISFVSLAYVYGLFMLPKALFFFDCGNICIL